MKKTDSFIGRFFLLCSSNILLQLLGFVYRILLSRYAGTEGLGVYRLATSIYAILHTTCLSGVTMMCTRFAAAWKAEGKSGAIDVLVRVAFSIFGTLFLLVSSVTWFGRSYIGENLIGDRRVILAIPIMLACLLLTGIENIFKSVMIGLNCIDNAVISELTEQLVRILAAAALLSTFATGDLGYTAVLIYGASVISEISSACIMTGMYWKMQKPKRTPPPLRYRQNILITVVPVSFAALCSNMISSAGSILLPKRLVSSGLSSAQAVSELGAISGVAAPIITLPMALILSLCTVTMPEISARYHTGTPQSLTVFSEKILRSVGLIGIPFTALLLPLAPVISRLFFYHAVDQSLFLWMGVSCIFSYYQMITGCLLNGSGQQTWNAITTTTGELLQLALVWWLAGNSHLRLYGYIAAQCIAPLLVSACNFYLLHRTRVINLRFLPQLSESVVCGILLYLWTRIFFTGYSGLFDQWAALLLTIGTALFFYLFLLRLLDVDLRRYLVFRAPAATLHPMFY